MDFAGRGVRGPDRPRSDPELPPIDWSVQRAAPAGLRVGLTVADVALLLAPLLAQPWLHDHADRVAPLLGPIAPAGAGLGLTLVLGACLVACTLTWASAAWLRRRYGRCDRRGDLLVFHPPLMLGRGLIVRRDDVTDWEVGPRGLLLRALAHTPAAGGSGPVRRGAVAALLTPLLVPTTDPAEVARTLELLEHRA